MLVHLMANRSILRPFGIFYVIWDIFSRFWYIAPRKIWQPRSAASVVCLTAAIRSNRIMKSEKKGFCSLQSVGRNLSDISCFAQMKNNALFGAGLYKQLQQSADVCAMNGWSTEPGLPEFSWYSKPETETLYQTCHEM
jgi:hypothetical protein